MAGLVETMAISADRALELDQTCLSPCLIMLTTDVQVWVGLNLAPALVDAEVNAGNWRRVSRMRLDPTGDSGPQLASLVLPRNQAAREHDAEF